MTNNNLTLKIRVSLLIIVALLFSKKNLISQAYYPFPDSAVWTVEERDEQGNLTHFHYYKLNYNDTIIGSDTAKVLMHKIKDILLGITIPYFYDGAILENGKKIYFYPYDSLNKELLYDFSANVGDTVVVWDNSQVFLASDSVRLIVDSIIYNVSVPSLNPTLNTNLWYLSYIDLPGLQEMWLEEVGLIAPGGALHKRYLALLSGSESLVCFSKDNLYGDCETVGISDYTLNSNYKIYPNPTNNYITIETEIAYDKVKFFDMVGNELYSVVSQGSTIDVSQFSRGIYLMRLYVGVRPVVSSKIVLN